MSSQRIDQGDGSEPLAPASDRGWGYNFTKALYFERRFLTWWDGGFTVFQFIIIGTVAVAMALVPSIAFGYRSWTLIASVGFLVFGLVLGMNMARTLHKATRHGKRYSHYLIDTLLYRFSAKHIVNGRPYFILWRRTGAVLEVTRSVRRHNA